MIFGMGNENSIIQTCVLRISFLIIQKNYCLERMLHSLQLFMLKLFLLLKFNKH